MRSLWLACAIGCTVPVQASHGPPTWSTAGPSVVSVLPTWPGFTRPGLGAPAGTAPEGSGVFWSPNAGAMSQYLLTAAHVVARATAIQVRMADGVLIDAAVIGLDRETDVALLATSVSGPAIRVAERRPSTGSHVCALGNAFGLGVSMTWRSTPGHLAVHWLMRMGGWLAWSPLFSPRRRMRIPG